ncbi:DUF3102 domain-containing protein [Bacillus altitudinis]|uniref:DUF3102 domain-containing protein n=1 Tax=Bacillus altitudinis TaxID=293387 RepID=UPI001F2E4C2D|nr:DUF3102 domain-containing protein [Bacillus altitudinis]UTX10756.1 DUF3102 domain-containing protein [Bacillus altitudinis]
MGRRLKHVKENDLVHGEWEKWLESVEIDTFQASRFIKVFDNLSESNLRPGANLGLKALYEIASFPDGCRNVPHQIPSTGETKTVDEMTVRELREVKKALKESEQDKKRLVRELDEARNMDHDELIEDLSHIGVTRNVFTNKNHSV